MTIMTAPIAKVLSAVLAALLVLGACNAACAKHKKKPRVKPAATSQSAPVSHAPVDKDGTPIIMNDYPAPRASKLETEPQQHGDHPITIPRGSSTYIPPPNPSPSGGPPPASMLQTVPQPAPLPPPANFGDKATNCMQSFPLNKGVGNNSSDMQTYVRQCAN
jgi:hypothetical protein